MHACMDAGLLFPSEHVAGGWIRVGGVLFALIGMQVGWPRIFRRSPAQTQRHHAVAAAPRHNQKGMCCCASAHASAQYYSAC